MVPRHIDTSPEPRLAAAGAAVTLTDIPSFVETGVLQKNIEVNAAAAQRAGGSAVASGLDWADAGRAQQLAALDGGRGGFQLVLGSELLYAAPILADPPSHGALIGTLVEALGLRQGGGAVGLFAQEWHMGFEELFFEEAEEAGLKVETLLDAQAGTLKVLRLTLQVRAARWLTACWGAWLL